MASRPHKPFKASGRETTFLFGVALRTQWVTQLTDRLYLHCKH